MPYANNQGVNIYYEVAGQGQPLMLAHGGFGDMTVWKDYGYVEMLKDKYMVILMDARGHGKSDKLYEPTFYGYQLMTIDVIAVLDDLGLEKVHYWGWSMSGFTAYGLAKHYPERIHSLIIGGQSPFPSDRKEIVELLRRGVNEGMDVLIEDMQAQRGGPLVPQVEARIRNMDLRAHLACHQGQKPSLGDVLPTMTMPCLVYTGEFDEAAETAEFVEHMPHASLFILPGRRHSDTSLAVDVLVPRVLEFLSGLE